MKAIILFVVISFATLGCQYDPFAGDMTTEKPVFSQVVGTYKFETQTLGSDSLNKIFSSGYIVLNTDSTFKAINLPLVTDDKYSGTISGKGKWHIEILGGVDNGGGTKNEWGLYLDGLPESVKYVGFTGEKFPYKLMITYGDPDEGNVVIFKRI